MLTAGRPEGARTTDANGAADLALVSGAVSTMDPAGTRAQAVAVRGGRIVAVGADADVRAHVGPRTEIIDLRGRAVLPGFQDAHVHAPSAGLDRLRIDLSEAHSVPEYARLIRGYADAHPEADWLLGGGWSMDVFPGGAPRAEVLDEIVGDRPVFINNRDNHGAWVNSRAMELAGIDRATPDPADGRFERDPDGRPTGALHEGAMNAVRRLVPPTSVDDVIAGLLVAQAHLHSLGITGWQDAIVGDYSTLADSFDAYVATSEDGRLTARVVGALWWERDRDEAQIDGFIERRSRAGNGRFRATTVKIMQDGVCENFTASLLSPYLIDGEPTGGTGISFIDPESLGSIVPALDARGFQVHIHAIGERAVRDALDAFQAARRINGMNDHRHHIAHLQLVHPADIPRFRSLGVVANAQPLWAAYEPQMRELTIPFLGAERSQWQYPFGTLARDGARLAFGSDWPVSSPNPFWELHVAVNRTLPAAYPYAGAEGPEADPFLPGERLDRVTAMRAFTMGSAYVNHLDGDCGSIEVDKLADLVVVDRDPFATAEDEFWDAEVLLTLVEGRAVHEATGL
jgi:predicted amidohydrolase YtcJ